MGGERVVRVSNRNPVDDFGFAFKGVFVGLASNRIPVDDFGLVENGRH